LTTLANAFEGNAEIPYKFYSYHNRCDSALAHNGLLTWDDADDPTKFNRLITQFGTLPFDNPDAEKHAWYSKLQDGKSTAETFCLALVNLVRRALHQSPPNEAEHVIIEKVFAFYFAKHTKEMKTLKKQSKQTTLINPDTAKQIRALESDSSGNILLILQCKNSFSDPDALQLKNDGIIHSLTTPLHELINAAGVELHTLLGDLDAKTALETALSAPKLFHVISFKKDDKKTRGTIIVFGLSPFEDAAEYELAMREVIQRTKTLIGEV